MSDTPARPPRVDAFTHAFIAAEEPSARLMLVLHGRGDSLEGFLWLPEALGDPRVNFLLLDGPDRYFIGYSWYDLPPEQGPGILRSRALLQGLLRDLAAQGWPSAQTLLFGFSQGCLMSIDVGLRHGEPLAGIVGISGYAHFLDRLAAELHPQALRQAWLITHGSHDSALPVERSRAQVERLRQAGLPIAWHEFPKDHEIDPDQEWPLVRRWIAARWP